MPFVKIIIFLSILELILGGKVMTTLNDGKLECPQNMTVNKLMVEKLSNGVLYTIECENTTSCASNCEYTNYECSPKTSGSGSYLRGIRTRKTGGMELYCCESDGQEKDCESPKYVSNIPYTISSENKKKVMHSVVTNNGGIPITVRMCTLKSDNDSQPCPQMLAGGGHGKGAEVVIVVGGGGAAIQNVILPPIGPAAQLSPLKVPPPNDIPPKVCVLKNTRSCVQGTCPDTSGTILPGATARGDCVDTCFANLNCVAYNFKGSICVIFTEPCKLSLNTGGNYCTVTRKCV